MWYSDGLNSLIADETPMILDWWWTTQAGVSTFALTLNFTGALYLGPELLDWYSQLANAKKKLNSGGPDPSGPEIWFALRDENLETPERGDAQE